MIFPAGTHMTFPATVRGRARAAEIAARFPQLTALDARHPHLIHLGCDFDFRPAKAASAPAPRMTSALTAE